MKMRLPLHEWCIILLFCSILLMLSAFAISGRQEVPSPRPAEIKSKTLEVRIEGQVAKPGLYDLPLKTTMKELLARAEPLPAADLSHVNLRRKLRDGQAIQIPKKEYITIEVVGMVQQPGPMKILSGTRIYELVAELNVLPEADIKALSKRKSYLYEGDVLEIPAKKSKKKTDSKNTKRQQ